MWRTFQSYIEDPVLGLLWAFGEWHVVITNPTDARFALAEAKPDILDKYQIQDVLPGTIISKFLSNNIVTSEHSDWKRHRRVTNPAFARSAWDTEPIAQCTRHAMATIDAWTESSEHRLVNIHELMSGITIDVMGKLLFDTNFGAIDDSSNRFNTLYRRIITSIFNPVYMLLPFLDTRWNPFRRQLYHDLDELDELFYVIFQQKLANIKQAQDEGDETKSDLLTLLIKSCQSEATDDDTKTWPLSVHEIKMDAILYYLASVDSSANALACAIYELARNQTLQDRARQEVMSILGDDLSDAPTYHQQRQMEYLTMVIKETLRKYPSIAVVPTRRAKQDLILPSTGQFVPRGTPILVWSWAIHNHPLFFSDPEVFDPARFSASSGADAIYSADHLGWMPFGGGRRACIGFSLAMTEMRTVLAMLLRKYRFRLRECDMNSRLRFKLGVMLQPTNAMVVIEKIS
ncbi:cytochrome P450 [Ramicandelaber brevisporus]|nr:cytochrome P450 [Ramicandelaber brevisporus]